MVVKPVPPVVDEKETKPRGPVQVHPQLYLLLEPLQPIKVGVGASALLSVLVMEPLQPIKVGVGASALFSVLVT